MSEVGLADEIDGLEVVELVDRDGRREIYRGRKRDREVVVKLQAAAAEADEKGDFEREGALLASVGHPAVPHVWEVGEVAGRGYTTMEYIEGESLAEAGAARRRDEVVVARWALELLEVLDALHRRGLVHRDIKPSNIMFERDGRLRLIDFGFTARTDRRGSETESGPGTTAYSAPEQLDAIDAFVDGRADLYSLGVVLYEVFAGERPFRGASHRELVRQHAAVEPDSLRSYAPEVSEGMARFVDRLLQKDPADRYTDAAAAARRLADIADEEGRDQLDPSDADGEAVVGRREEWDRLEQAWSAVEGRGEGRAIGIHGEAGVGKSYLVSRFIRRVPAAGTPIATERGVEGESAPMVAIRSLLRRWLTDLREQRSERLEERRSEWSELLDQAPAGLRTALVGPLEVDVPEGEPEQLDSEEYFESVVEFIVEFGQLLGPAMLVLDDVQWLEYASRQVLRRLITRIEDVPLLVVATTRASEGDTVGFGRRDATFRFELKPFDRDDTARMLAVHLGLEPEERADLEEAFIEEFWSHTRGVPFLAADYLHTLLDSGAVYPDWGRWRYDASVAAELELSKTSMSYVRARLDRLEFDEPSRRVLEAATILGRGFDHELLTEVSGASAEVVGRTVERARRARLLERSDDEGYAFVHERLRESMVDEIESRRLERLHRAAAEALEGRDGELYAKARHHLRGGADGDPRSAFRALRRAGRQALDEYGYEEALEFLEAAEALADDRDELEFGADDRVALAEAAQYSGELEQAQREYRRAVEMVDEPPEEADIRSKLAESYMWDAMETRRAREQIEAAFDTLGVTSSADTRIWFFCTSLGLWIAGLFVAATGLGRGTASGDKARQFRTLARLYQQGQNAEYWAFAPFASVLYVLRGLYATQRLGESPEMVRVYSNSGAIFAALGVDSLAERFTDRGLEVARRLERPALEALAEVTKGWSITMLGRPVESSRRLTRFLDESGHWVPTGEYVYSCTEVAWNFGVRGYLEECIDWIELARSRLGREGTQRSPLLVLGFAADLAQLGEFDRAEAFLDEAERKLEQGEASAFQRSMYLSGELVVAHTRHQWKRMVQALEGWRDLELRPALTPLYIREFYVYGAYGLLDLLEQEAADWFDGVEERLASMVSDLETAARGHPTLEAHRAVVRGAVARRDERHDAALEHWSDAEATALEHDAPWAAFEARWRRARAIADRGSGSIALQEARGARRMAREHGWEPKLRRLHDEFPGLDAPRSRASDSTVSSGGPKEWAADAYFDTLKRVSMAASRASDSDEQIRRVLEEVIGLLGAERGVILLVEEGELERATSLDAEGREVDEMQWSQEVVEHVRSAGEPVAVRGPRDAERRGFESLVGEDVRSVAAAPLEIRDRFRGVIYLDSRLARGVFSEDDLDVLSTLASHVPIALETVRAAQLEGEVESEREQRRVAETLRTTLVAMNETLDVGAILEVLVEGVADELELENGWAIAVSCGEMRKSAGTLPEELATKSGGFDIDESEMLEEVVDQREVRRISDADVPGVAEDPAVRERAASWLGVPLSAPEDVVGALVLEADRRDGFEPEAEELAKLFAGQAAVAVQNARTAMRDALTGLYNRRYFQRIAEETFEQFHASSRPLSAVILDLDHFKSINDEFGHAAGDTVLEAVADVLRRETRPSDVVARYGGEEFVVMLPGTEIEPGAERVAERLRRAIGEVTVDWNGDEIAISASLGVAAAREGDDVERLLQRADRALYRAKDAGRDRVRTA